jgi:thiol-disulfide isomerase/thioredoxin
MSLVTFLLAAVLLAGQTARPAVARLMDIGVWRGRAEAVTAQSREGRPVTLVAEVRAALNAHDLTRAEAIVAKRRAEQGNTAEVLEAASWLGRGALAEKQYDRAEQYAVDVQKQILTALAGRPVDVDPKFATALGATIEVQAQASAARGARSEAVVYLQRELGKYKTTSMLKRIQKNINLLTLEGQPAPALDKSENIGPPLPSSADLKGKVVLLFFWAHWCPDCKAEAPVLAKMLAKYRSQGLMVVAPTQRYGYVAGGKQASPDDELRYIVEMRDTVYAGLKGMPAPVSVANHERYGVSTTPTNVIVDRQGNVRAYRPGQMTEAELEAALAPLLAANSSAVH